MITVDFIIIGLLVAAFVFFILGFFLAPRYGLWGAALGCAVVAVILKVFGVG